MRFGIVFQPVLGIEFVIPAELGMVAAAFLANLSAELHRSVYGKRDKTSPNLVPDPPSP